MVLPSLHMLMGHLPPHCEEAGAEDMALMGLEEAPLVDDLITKSCVDSSSAALGRSFGSRLRQRWIRSLASIWRPSVGTRGSSLLMPMSRIACIGPDVLSAAMAQILPNLWGGPG